ncbi:MAG: GAF domain-containing protein, partial [Bacteroidetes bacterium]|nr:GAF domain-containing protein [Bacteroidota bacterium]
MPEQAKDNFAVLYEIAQKINSILDRQELLDSVIEIAMSHLDAERGFIVLLDDSAENNFNVVAAKNFSSEKDVEESAASSSVINKVLTTGEPVLTFDALSDERFEASRSIVAQQLLS